MDLYVVSEDCTACGVCFRICGEVFKPDDKGISNVVEDSDDMLPCVMEAMFACPTGAIRMEN